MTKIPLFYEQHKLYGFENYTPHMTLSKDYVQPTLFLEGRTFEVDSFYLALKEDNVWTPISRHKSKKI
jgi:hypothetical protein